MRKWWSGLNREYKLLLLSFAFIGLTSGIYDSTFNNYLNDVFHISAKVRGIIEFPRELPGFLVALVSGLLIFLPDVRMLGISLGLIGVGLIGQSIYSWGGEPHFSWMIMMMVLWSFGAHIYMPFSNSVAFDHAPEGQEGKILGQLNGVNNLVYIIGCASIWLLVGVFKINYGGLFRIAALFALIAAAYVFLMRHKNIAKRDEKKVRFVFRKEYSLFYFLNILFGARKQVFLTFAPWVLIKIYHEPATTIATLLFVASFFGIFFKPLLGHLIDRVGERFVIMAESSLLILVCLGYGFAGHLGLAKYAIYLVFFCYILDQLLFAVTMARTTYIRKNLIDSSDLTPTLSMGISMDHAVSMTIPMFGGLLWMKFGYESIFLAAAGVALINLLVASRIKQPMKNNTQSPGI